MTNPACKPAWINLSQDDGLQKIKNIAKRYGIQITKNDLSTTSTSLRDNQLNNGVNMEEKKKLEEEKATEEKVEETVESVEESKEKAVEDKEREDKEKNDRHRKEQGNQPDQRQLGFGRFLHDQLIISVF